MDNSGFDNIIPLSNSFVQECVHPDVAMEWWFFQGQLNSVADGIRHFMLALFRHRYADSDGVDLTGYTLLVSHLDPQSGQHWCSSRISPEVQDILLHHQSQMAVDDFDAQLVELIMSHIRTHGPLPPVEMEMQPVHMAEGRLDFCWADTAFVQDGADFEVGYLSPEDGRPCRLHITPEISRLRFDWDAGQDQTMAYASIPRATVKGQVGETDISGRAWIDHQWGGYAWFFSRDANCQILGWEWFGISMDDGSHVLLMCHRDMRTMALTTRHAIYLDPEGFGRPLTDFSVTPLRIWESPATLGRYPIGWQLNMSEIHTELTIEPLADDQEIPVFGFMRTVWEGACHGVGTKNGRPISAHVRLELHGYGYIFDFKTYLGRWGDRIDRCIEDLIPRVLDEYSMARLVGRFDSQTAKAHTHMLSEPIWDMIDRGGKRWRPVFGYLLLKGLGVSHLPYEQLLATIIELSHLGSLMIDDIEDQSPIRRGREAAYLKYGLDLTINTGNTLYFLPLLLLEDHPALTPAQREAIYGVMVRNFVRVHFGQGMDIYWSKSVTQERLETWSKEGLQEQVLKMYADKTSAPVVGLAHVVCIIAQADDSVRHACLDFAEGFGMAFQIMDDVHNFSASGKWTKVVGEDLAGGKLTYAILGALKELPEVDRRYLQLLLCDEEMRQRPDQLEKGIRLIRESGALEVCRKKAQAIVRQRWADLSRFLPSSEAKIMLHLLCSRLTHLSFDG